MKFGYKKAKSTHRDTPKRLTPKSITETNSMKVTFHSKIGIYYTTK